MKGNFDVSTMGLEGRLSSKVCSELAFFETSKPGFATVPVLKVLGSELPPTLNGPLMLE
jgi:hypothetical protein